MNTKQVIIWRADLNIRKGKCMSQSGHAALAFITKRLKQDGDKFFCNLTQAEQDWLNSSFRKIVLQVENEAELVAIYKKALDAGLEAHLIVDSGLTEFHGVPTTTCCAIGPDYDERINPITKDLKLY